MLRNRKVWANQRGLIHPKSVDSRQRANWNWTFKVFPVLIFTMAIIVVNGSQVQAADNEANKLPAGRWRGVFLFNLDHTWDASQTKFVNYYSLQSEIVAGDIVFAVDRNGQITYSRIKIPPFPYTVVSSLIDDRYADNPCKGYNVYGGGMATAKLSTRSSTAAKLAPNNIIDVPAVQITTNSTWGKPSVIGDCGGEPPSDSLDNALKADFNMLSVSNWKFTATAIYKTWMAGSCTTSSWTTENRSINCWWSAWRSGK